MKCQRCDGIMVPEAFYGQDDVFQGWRCIFCGEIIDRVILRNRWTQKLRTTRSPVRRRHFEILLASDDPASAMAECIRD